MGGRIGPHDELHDRFNHRHHGSPFRRPSTRTVAPQADFVSTDGTDTTDYQGMLVFTATGSSARFTLTTASDVKTLAPEMQVQEQECRR